MKTALKTAFKIAGFAVLALVLLVALGLAGMSFQGRRELAAVRADLLARGEKLSLVELAPPPIPDAENFFADPLWQPSADGKLETLNAILKERPAPVEVAEWNRSLSESARLDPAHPRAMLAREAWRQRPDAEGARFVLSMLQPLDPTLDRIHALLARPGARFPIDYAKTFGLQPHLSPLLKLGQVLGLRTQARLALGDLTGAHRDVLDLVRLSDVLAREPLLVPLLVRAAFVEIVSRSLAAGLAIHRWTDDELRELQRALGTIDLLAGLAHALRGERGYFNDIAAGQLRQEVAALKQWGKAQGSSLPETLRSDLAVRTYLALGSAGDQAFYNRHLQRMIDAVDQASEHGLRPDRIPSEDVPELRSPARFRYFRSAVALPSLTRSIAKIAQSQTTLTQAVLACALERYFLRYGEYPATLDALVPDFLSGVPRDIVTRRPMPYARTAPGSYRLWSVGWDLQDDQGAPWNRKTKRGDWTWNVPPEASR